MGQRVGTGRRTAKEGVCRRLAWSSAAFVASAMPLVLPRVAWATPPTQAAPPAPPTSPAAGASPQSALTERAHRGQVVPPAVDDVEQVCALLTSCDHLPIPASMVPTDFATCVRAIAGELASPGGVAFSLLIRECGLRANSCAELRSCGLRGANPAACAGRGKDNPAGYCDIDGRALSCFQGHVVGVRDCPRGGEQCSVREGQASCSLGPCPKEILEGAAPVCSASGTRILRCAHGVLNSLDCEAFGLICATSGASSGGGAACASPTATCSRTDTRCDGNVGVTCYNGHEVRVDCAAASMSCATVAPSGQAVGVCVAPPPAATGASTTCSGTAPARCDGATLRYCFAGQARSFLCKTLGFNRCISDASGARCG